jgi:hypothetical protein
MTDNSGAGYLELEVSDLKLDKTTMEKQATIEVDIDNKNIATVLLGRVNKKVKTQIDGRNEIMELKIMMGRSGKEADHIGKSSTFYLITKLIIYIIDSFFIPIDFFREATPESITGYEVKRKEEGWIYFDKNGYLLKDSRRKRRGVNISFTFLENGTGAGASVSSTSNVRKTYNAKAAGSGGKSTGIKKSPAKPTSEVRKSTTAPIQSTPSSSSTWANRSQVRRPVERTEYKAEHLDLRQYYTAPQVRLSSEAESFGIFPEKYDTIKRGVRAELNNRCDDIATQTKNQNANLDKNINGFSEDSRKINTAIDTIQNSRERNIKETRLNTLEILDSLSNKNEGLDRLQAAHGNLTAKQNEFLTKEHQLNNLRHGNSLIGAILSKGTDLNTQREQLYSKYNEIVTKDIEGQRTEVLKILKETEDEAKEGYKSAEIDRILSDIAHAIKTAAVDEIRKRETLQDKNQRDLTRATDQNTELSNKIKNIDDNITKLGHYVENQKKEIEHKEADLAAIRENIKKERLGLVQDENKNADLEKKLQEMMNRLRFFEQERLYLQTEKNVTNTKVNIAEQLMSERDQAMMDWMQDRIKDEKNKKALLEEKMNQCYSFETKDIIELFKKEKGEQIKQRQEFIDSLREELNQKLENEKIIKGNVDAASEELKKIKGSAKKAPVIDADHDVDHDKLYTDLKEATLDNLDKNQTLATNKKDVKELEVKIMLIEDDINNIRRTCQELEDAINVPLKVYPSLVVDESELNRLKKELADKRAQLQALEKQKDDLGRLVIDKENEYKNIKIYKSQRFTIREEGEDPEERKTFAPVQRTFASPEKVEMSPSEIRKTRLSQSPALTRDVENVMKEVYYGRPGPKIRKTEDGTFVYGTREFIVTKEKGNLFARDFEADESEKMNLEQYLKKHEKIERDTALKTNLQYLNDDIGSEDEEMAEVGEEFNNEGGRFGVY